VRQPTCGHNAAAMASDPTSDPPSSEDMLCVKVPLCSAEVPEETRRGPTRCFATCVRLKKSYIFEPLLTRSRLPMGPPMSSTPQSVVDDTFASAQLSVSHPTLDCAAVTRDLARAGIMASVVENRSVVCSGDAGCRVEVGCRILFNRMSREQIATTWQQLRRDHALACAHLSAPPVFSGCVWDFLHPSLCPGRSGHPTGDP